jgi:hypothetical protein
VNYTIALKFINDGKSEKRRLKVFSRIQLSPTSVITLVIVAVVVILVLPSIPALLLLPLSYAQQQGQNAAINSASCISYDSTDNIIIITCDSNLTDVDNQLKR